MYANKWLMLILFLNVINKMFTNHIYLINMNEQDWALNNLQWLICHKIQTNQPYDKSINILIVICLQIPTY